jgi:Family of unknown function (DUF5908)
MIEIRELSIEVRVNPEPQNEPTRGNRTTIPRLNKKAIIKECLEQVSEMLKNKNER